jgi:hypothetical protein
VVSGLVEIARFGTPVEGELARTFFESYGLNPIIFDANIHVNMDGLHTGVRLMVAADELKEALEVLREYRR